MVGAQPFEAVLARADRAVVGRILREDLRCEKHAVTPADQSVTDQLLDRATPVELRGVDVRHAEIDRAMDRGHRVLRRVALHVPRAEADLRHVDVERPELPLAHGGILRALALSCRVSPWIERWGGR